MDNTNPLSLVSESELSREKNTEDAAEESNLDIGDGDTNKTVMIDNLQAFTPESDSSANCKQNDDVQLKLASDSIESIEHITCDEKGVVDQDGTDGVVDVNTHSSCIVNATGGTDAVKQASDISSVSDVSFEFPDNSPHDELGTESIGSATFPETFSEVLAIGDKAKYVYEERNENASDGDAILTPLTLDPSTSSVNSSGDTVGVHKKLTFALSRQKMSDTELPCMMCDYIENDTDLKKNRDGYLCHLLLEHKLIIADVNLIADLQSYAIYWKKRFQEEPLESFFFSFQTNSAAKDIGKSEKFYLLCDALPEDRKIREQLQFDKLKKLLLRQEFERKDETFSRRCPFCVKFFQGNRLVLFNHMTVDHNFNIGHPDNIVNVRELLDDIQKKLDSLQCLFCENTYKDRVTLREHMRKKGHRRLNPGNKDYDKYYTINYLELGKNWQVLQGESERLDPVAEDWSGWYEEGQKAVCFFCTSSYDQADKVYAHMKEEHNFDFMTLREEMQLSFYQQIKLINYIRREVHLATQEGCSDVVEKIKNSLKTSTKWNQPQYYFPTYEDDTLLCQLVDKEGLFEPEDTFVIGEDGIDCKSILNNSVLTDLVVSGYFDS